MSNMKNSEDQVSYVYYQKFILTYVQCDDLEKEQLEKTYDDLKDSEEKLKAMLIDIDVYNKNIIEETKNIEVKIVFYIFYA